MVSSRILKKTSGILDLLTLFFTVFLLGYGFLKGYYLIELTIYNVYFIVILINQIINLKIKKT